MKPLFIKESPYHSKIYEIEAVESLYEKVYWFARGLIASEYGSAGGNNKNILKLAGMIDYLLSASEFKVERNKKLIWETIRGWHKVGTQAASKIEKLIDYLDPLIENKTDFSILKFSVNHIIIPTNQLLEYVPKSDREVAEELIRAYLREEGEEGLKDVILMWDREGRRYCLRQERTLVVAGYRLLRELLEDLLLKKKMTRIDVDYILTAFIQEFERRLVRGVRPTRAGRSLEDVTGVILDHFGIEDYVDAPDHIKTVFEIDKMIPLEKGWRIGVSCKRTLRERWKQAASLDANRLDEEKIKSTWHVITYTSDLTVPKVKAIGESRGILFVPDSDNFLKENSYNPKISDYLFPMTSFISKLRDLSKT